MECITITHNDTVTYLNYFIIGKVLYFGTTYSTKYKNILLAISNHYNLKYKEIDKIFKLMYIQKTKTKILDYEDVYKHLYK